MNVFHALPTELHLFRERLKRLRGERGWTLEALAARAVLSTPYLSRLESSERQPSIAALLSLAQVYGLSVGDLFASPQRHTPVVVRAGRLLKARQWPTAY